MIFLVITPNRKALVFGNQFFFIVELFILPSITPKCHSYMKCEPCIEALLRSSKLVYSNITGKLSVCTQCDQKDLAHTIQIPNRFSSQYRCTKKTTIKFKRTSKNNLVLHFSSSHIHPKYDLVF
jgi:hypothetical protein